VDVNAVAVAVASPNTPSGTPDAVDIKKRSNSFISRRVLQLSQSKKQLGQQSKPAAEAPVIRRLASLQDGEIEAATRSPSVPRLPLSSPTAASREDERGRKRVGFGIRRMLGVFGEQRKNPQRHKLLPATSADMAGTLWKQGTKIGAWQRRYFVLHGALLSYYADEESAQEPDEGRLHGVGTVLDARLWGNAKPAQIPDATCALPQQHACMHSSMHSSMQVLTTAPAPRRYREHQLAGFRIVTEEREFMVYADTAASASRWVDL
jgi:hypothetical protein